MKQTVIIGGGIMGLAHAVTACEADFWMDPCESMSLAYREWSSRRNQP